MIVVYGTVCLDRLHRLAGLPAPGGYVDVEATHVSAGGEAVNTAAALQRWGARVVLLGNSIGAGPEADRLRELVAALGLDASLLPPGDHPVPVCDIYVTPDGARTMFGQGFRDMERTGTYAGAPWAAGGWFAADGNHRSRSIEAAATARSHGMRLHLMDLPEGVSPLGPGDVWQTSTDVLGHAGLDGPHRARLEAVAARGCAAVLTDGRHGLLVAEPDCPLRRFPSFPAPQVVDATGAGDAFRAGTIFGLEQGWPFRAAIRFGAAAGALNCRALGAVDGLPDRAEVDGLIGAHPRIAAAYD